MEFLSAVHLTKGVVLLLLDEQTLCSLRIFMDHDEDAYKMCIHLTCLAGRPFHFIKDGIERRQRHSCRIIG